MADSKYELTIGSHTFRFQEEEKIDGCGFYLEELSYDKGIYRPSEMYVRMNVTEGAKYKSLLDNFHMKPVSLKIKISKGKEVTDYMVAENYFVFKVKPTFRKTSTKSSAKLELTIFSQDKLMTLDKYSKAWSGKKLIKDIFDKEIANFKFGSNTISYEASPQILAYGSDKGDEFVQPYLVQYNESFYDFLSRTACRCGEFLYHEHGKLHFGMAEHDLTGTADYADMAAELYYEDIPSQGTDTTDYGYDYLKSHADPGGNPYSDPLTYDDYLNDVPSTYTNADEQMDTLSKNIVSALCMALEGTSFSNILDNFSAQFAFKKFQANAITANLNAFHTKINTAEWMAKDDQKRPDGKIRQFGTASDKTPKSGFAQNINLNSKFYALVRKAERKVSEKVVYLEFEEKTQKLFIGDKISVDANKIAKDGGKIALEGGKYVVIGVKGSCCIMGETEPSLIYKTFNVNYEERQQVVAVRLYGDSDICIPPAMPLSAYRESQPQLAFVVQNFDPQRIGRVRVRFAWQPSSGDGSDATPWIRVALPFATDGAGVKFKPETGDEVMVSFEEGNMERPYVTGFLLGSRSNKSWEYPIPDRTITSKNGHNITFNDGLDGASFYWGLAPGLKLIKSFIPNATWPNLLEDSTGHMALAGGMTLSDRYGLYKIALSTDSRSVLIQSAMGDVKVSAFTGITISAPNGNIDLIGKNINIKASNKVNIESGSAIKNRFFAPREKYKEGMFEVENKLGRIALDVVLETARGAVNRTVEKAVDLKLMRTVLETFTRPIEGTTKIKSFTFVQIEAGKGSTEYPQGARKESGSAVVARNLYATIGKVVAIAHSKVYTARRAYSRMCSAIQAFNNISGQNCFNSDEKYIKFSNIKNVSYKEDKGEPQYNNLPTVQEIKDKYKNEIENIKNSKPKEDDDKYKDKNAEQQKKLFDTDLQLWNQQNTDIQKKLANELTKLTELKSNVEELNEAIHTYFVATHKDFNSVENLNLRDEPFSNEIKKTVESLKFDQSININKGTTLNTLNNWENIQKHCARTAVYLFLTHEDVRKAVNSSVLKFKSSQKNKSNLNKDDRWNDLVDDFVTKSVTRMEKAKDNAVALKEWAASTYLSPFTDGTVNMHRWQTGVEGKILFSDNSEKTYSFDKNGATTFAQNMMFTDRSCDNLRRYLKTIE